MEARGLIPILLYITLTGAKACVYCCNCGTLSPPDPYVTIGGTLELTCSINNASNGINSSNLHFQFNYTRTLPEENLVILDNKTVKYIQHNITVEDEGIYSCKFRGQRGDKSAYVGHQYLTVDYPLREVTNFSCIIYDWDKELICSWELGRYRYKNLINVSVLGCNDYNHYDGTCNLHPPLNYNDTHALWTRGEVSIDVNLWIFRVIVKHKKLESNSTTDIPVQNLENIVKPYPLQNVTIMVIDSTTATLSLSVPRRRRDQMFNISYQSAWNDTFEKLIVYKSQDLNRLWNITELDNLHPYTQYRVSVTTRPLNTIEQPTGFWSNPVSINFTTLQDVPSDAPRLVSFTADIQTCLNGYHNRNITVYWEEIAKEKRNGLIMQYEVTINTTKKQFIKRFNQGVMTGATVPVPCGTDTYVSVRAGTIQGFSRDFHTIYIPSSQREIIPPALVLEESSLENGIYIYWSPPTNVVVQNFTLLWCYNRCKEDNIQMLTLDESSDSTFLQRRKNSEDIQIGLAINTVVGSSGVTWNTCTYRRGSAPLRPERVLLASEEKGIIVSWRMRNCGCQCEFGYPTKYKIEWCEGNKHCQDLKEIIVPLDNLTHTIGDVQYDMEYSVRVTALTRDNLPSITSDTVTIVHYNPNMKPGEIVAIALGCIFGLIVLAAGMVFLIRHGMQSVKSCFLKPEIQLPSISKSEIKGGSSDNTFTGSSSPPATPDSCPDQPLLKDHLRNGGSSIHKLSNQISQDSGRGSLQSDQLSNIIQPVPELPQLSSLPDYCKFGARNGSNETSSNYRSCGEASSTTEDSYFSAGQKESSSYGADSSNFHKVVGGPQLEVVQEDDTSESEDESSCNITSYTKLGICSGSQESEVSKAVSDPVVNVEVGKVKKMDEIKDKIASGIDKEDIKPNLISQVYNVSDVNYDDNKVSVIFSHKNDTSDQITRNDITRDDSNLLKDVNNELNHNVDASAENSGSGNIHISQPDDTSDQDICRSASHNMDMCDTSSHNYDQSNYSSSVPYSTSTSYAKYVDINCSSDMSSGDVSSPNCSSAC